MWWVYFLILYATCEAWLVNVDLLTKECFFQRAKHGEKLAVTFQVIEGGLLDVDIAIRGPNDSVLYSEQTETSGKFNFAASMVSSLYLAGHLMS